MPPVEQELITLPEHLSSPPVFSGVHVTRSLVLCVCFVDHWVSFCTFFLLAIVLSVLFRFTDSDYSFGIFKLSLHFAVRGVGSLVVLIWLLRSDNDELFNFYLDI